MKKIIILALIFIPILLLAKNNDGSTLLNTYTNATTAWYPVFEKNALYLFSALAGIAFVLEISWIALQSNFEIGSIFAPLIKIILIFGIFLAFIQGHFLDSVFNSFINLGKQANSAAGVTTIVSIDTLIDSAYELLAAISDAQSIFKPVDSIFLGIIGIIAAIAVGWLGVELLMSYVKWLIMITISPLFLALGVLPYTRNYAMSTIQATISVSIEYMLIKLVIGLSILTIKDNAEKAMKDDGSLFTLLMLTLMLFGLTKMVHGIASSFTSGHMAGNSNAGAHIGKNMAMGAAAGAVGGAMAAHSTIKEAAASSGQGGSSSFKSSAMNFMKSTASAGAGAVSGAAKGGAGFSIHSAGQKTGSFIGGSVGLGNANVKGHTLDNESNKDRSGFDMSQLNNNSLSGDISPSTEK